MPLRDISKCRKTFLVAMTVEEGKRKGVRPQLVCRGPGVLLNILQDTGPPLIQSKMSIRPRLGNWAKSFVSLKKEQRLEEVK